MRLVLPVCNYNRNYIFCKDSSTDLNTDSRFKTGDDIKVNILYSDNVVTMRGIHLLYEKVSPRTMSEQLVTLDNDIFNMINISDINYINGSDVGSKWDAYISGYKGGCIRDDIYNTNLTVVVACSFVNIRSNVCSPNYTFDILSVG